MPYEPGEFCVTEAEVWDVEMVTMTMKLNRGAEPTRGRPAIGSIDRRGAHVTPWRRLQPLDD